MYRRPIYATSLFALHYSSSTVDLSYIVGKSVDDRTSNKDGLCTESNRFEDISSSPHSSVQVDLTSTSDCPYHVRQHVQLDHTQRTHQSSSSTVYNFFTPFHQTVSDSVKALFVGCPVHIVTMTSHERLDQF